MTKYYVDVHGNYLGGFDGAEPPENSVEVDTPPTHGLDKFINGAWVKYSPTMTLSETDVWMSRISEDTVVALIQAGTVTKDKFAPIVIERINYRRSLRNQPAI